MNIILLKFNITKINKCVKCKTNLFQKKMSIKLLKETHELDIFLAKIS